MIDESGHEYFSITKEKDTLQQELKTAEEQILKLKAENAKHKTMTEN